MTGHQPYPPPEAETISDELIETICSRLAENRQVRRTLPARGQLAIDRQVPFLCIYRHPSEQADEGTARLVTGEAAYLIASGRRSMHTSLARLVRRIATTMAEEFGGFLLVEIWAGREHSYRNNGEHDGKRDMDGADNQDNSDEHLYQPGFRIITHLAPNDVLVPTLARLEKSLSKIRLYQQPAQVEMVTNQKGVPPGTLPLLTAKEARSIKCRIIGLEVRPVYRDIQDGTLFPIGLRKLHHGTARALKQTFFEFVRTQTSHRPTHYHALGRRTLIKAVRDVDQQLADISSSFDFLLNVTPVNAASSWSAFKRGHFQHEPTFSYRPLPVDPVLLKRTLYNIPLERVEDPTLWQLFHEKQLELDQQISMLLNRGTPHFLYGSLQLFGRVEDTLLHTARELLHRIPPRSRDDSRSGYLDAHTFAEHARSEVAYYRQFYPALSASVEIRDDITTGLMVSHGNLLIGNQTRIPALRVDALLHHEIGTHMLTHFNGRAQPFQQLYSGLAGYEELQEGLAVLAEYLGGNLSRPRLRLLAGRVVAAHCLVDSASFLDTFRILVDTYQFDRYNAFTITMRIYRGGGLTKDAVYLRGLLRVIEYVHKGGDLEPLFVGKIAAAHIPIIRELQWRGVLHPAPLQPRYMQATQARERLERLRQGLSVYDLVKQSTERLKPREANNDKATEKPQGG